ncbi:MAG TPA: carboxypeptidase regulatory-like domain-containing protein [Firmicutes bacterium]|nr:carboxypeptidase regulatory-like domain-containing protein [Bacillota bacterium]
MSLWDGQKVTSQDGKTNYREGVDYEIDHENDTIKRLADSNIGDGDTVVVRYAKGIPGDILDKLKNDGSAVMRPVKAVAKILSNPDDDLFDSGTDISDSVVRLEIRQTLSGKPDKAVLISADFLLYSQCDLSTDVILGIAIGAMNQDGETRYTEVFRGLAVQREFVSSPDGAHHVKITAHDFSIALESPRQKAMGRTWHPSLRREVFRNGTIIADDYRNLRAASLFNTLDFDDIVEIHFAKEHPRAHEIIRDCVESAGSSFINKLIIDCLDFPVTFFDARDKTPGEVIREIANLAGAFVRAEGTTLIISERGFPGGFDTAWIYDAVTVLNEGEKSGETAGFNAVQIFGHSETSRIPTRSVYLPPTDFTQPGWYRVVDEKGTLEPVEPVRTDELPQPAELTFQLDASFYDPSSVRVIGGELAGRPVVELINGKPVMNVTVLIEWAVDDKAGECPFILDENGNRLFRIHGRVFDAVPSLMGEYLPIPHALVTREKLDGEDAGDSFEIMADEDGRYAFEAVPIGEYKIIASATGYLDNYSDDDPDNDEYRNLYDELQKWEDEMEAGRYEKKPTDYHVIVWARPRMSMGPLADLTVRQVLLEVRDKSTLSGANLVYSPAIRDNRITTEVLAKRIGRILLTASSQESPAITLRLPMNRWLRAGDGIRITGEEFDLSLPDGKPFQVTELVKVIEPEKGKAYDIVSSSPRRVARILSGGIDEDPLDTRVGTLVATYRNELHMRVYDVESCGRIYYGLGASPVLGEIAVGETVQIAKVSKGALTYLVVARTSDIFGRERICYV